VTVFVDFGGAEDEPALFAVHARSIRCLHRNARSGKSAKSDSYCTVFERPLRHYSQVKLSRHPRNPHQPSQTGQSKDDQER
jgi:hypothetical protein